MFAAIFLNISMIILAFIPIKLLYVVRKHRDELDDPEVLEKHGYLYQDLSTTSIWTASFNFIFMQRRTLFALIIIELRKFRGIQLAVNLVLTMAYILYLAHFVPY